MTTDEKVGDEEGRKSLAHTVSTDKFYQERADEYFAMTSEADLSTLHELFLTRLPPKARILDAGCGSGRDLKVFMSRGHDAVGIDASQALVTLARQFSGAACSVGRLEEIEYNQAFDGVWACASLLHLPRCMLPRVLERMRRAIAHRGTLFLALNEGHGEEVLPDGRLYVYHSVEEVQEATDAAGFEIEVAWQTGSASERRRPRWINVLAFAR